MREYNANGRHREIPSVQDHAEDQVASDTPPVPENNSTKPVYSA